MTDDVLWETPPINHANFGGRREGKEAVANFFSELLDAEEIIAQGNRVAVMGHYRGRIRATGKIADSPFVQIFTVRDSKISGFFEVYDTALAERAYQKSASA